MEATIGSSASNYDNPVELPPGFNFFKTVHGVNERIPVEALDFGANALFQLLKRYAA